MALDNDQIENEINELSSMKKVDDFLKLADFYHVERCENEVCSNCLFVVNLSYLNLQNTAHKQGSVAPLQKFWKMKFGNYHSIRLLLRSLGAIKKNSRTRHIFSISIGNMEQTNSISEPTTTTYVSEYSTISKDEFQKTYSDGKNKNQISIGLFYFKHVASYC